MCNQSIFLAGVIFIWNKLTSFHLSNICHLLELRWQQTSYWDELRKDGAKIKFDICKYVTDKWDENKNPNTKK